MIIERIQDYSEFGQYNTMIKQALEKSPRPQDNMLNVTDALWDDRAVLYKIMHDDETRGVFVLELVRHKGDRGINVWTMSGKGMDDALDDVLSHIEEVAKLHNCSWITCSGRRGWQRILEPKGYTISTITLEKRVEL